jgi:hypothetical protein
MTQTQARAIRPTLILDSRVVEFEDSVH